MQNKNWNSKLKSLLHSLDISIGSNVDEVKKFGIGSVDLKTKLNLIKLKYKKNDDSEEKINQDEMGEFSEFDENDPEFKDMLNQFFDEISKSTEKLAHDPLTDAVLIWFQELLIINNGQFKIVKNNDGSVNIIFGTDEIIENKKIISITEELTEVINGIDKKSIIYKELSDKEIVQEKPKKQPVKKAISKTLSKKSTPKKPTIKNGTRTKRQTEVKKTTKNKNTK